MKLDELSHPAELKATTTKTDILNLIEEAKTHQFKTVCVNPCYVKFAKEELLDSNILVCTIIGFPSGMNTIETKVFETLNAIHNGADEIEMVLNYGEVKSGNYDFVQDEIHQVRKACVGHSFGVRIDSSYLTEEEIIKISEIVSKSDANLILT